MRVSVIIPTHNRRSTIIRAIESAFAQSEPVSEVIVVDDCSTDDTYELLQPLLHRITYVANERTLGAQESRNRGIALAKGDVLAFLDSDDYWHIDKIRLQMNAARASGSTEFCVTCGYRQFGATAADRNFVPPPEIGLSTVLVHNLIGPTSNILISRGLIEKVGDFDSSMPSCQDWELFVRILDRVSIIGVPDVLTYQDTGSSTRISSNRRKVVSGHQAIFRRARATSRFKALPLLARVDVRLRQEVALLKRSIAHHLSFGS